MKKFDIITVGSGVVDAFLDTGMPEKHGDICFPSGQKILLKDLWYATGGGGTNTAVSFSKLGLRTGYLGVLGFDNNAQIILEELKHNKIKFLGYQINEPTGFSAIIDSKSHERTILTYKGANEDLDFNKLKLKKLKTSWLYLSAMTHASLHAQEKLARWAKKHGINVAYNPSSYLTKDGFAHLRKIIKNVHAIIMNKEEAEQLVSSKTNLFKKIHALGPKVVCITYGKDGNAVSDGKIVLTSIPNKIHLVERTGAGDAFASGFVTGLVRHCSIKEAIIYGSLNAESVIQKPGAKNGLLSWHEMEHQYKQNRIKLKRP